MQYQRESQMDLQKEQVRSLTKLDATSDAGNEEDSSQGE